jgi:hypothetical protein
MFDKEKNVAKKYNDVTSIVNGIKVTQCAYRGPRGTERTFPMTKGSVATMGAKNVSLMNQGFKKGKA